MAFTINIDGDKRIVEKFNNIELLLKDVKKPLNEIGGLLVTEFKENFTTEGSRLNEPWKQLAQSTLLQKARLGFGGMGILERTGKLKNSFVKTVQSFQVRVRNTASYFKYHQRGTGDIPQRRM